MAGSASTTIVVSINKLCIGPQMVASIVLGNKDLLYRDEVHSIQQLGLCFSYEFEI
ncbi:hypothetical protein HanIR_Chr04g0153301 [Helianthus annuus]|nr:hypothetical protein HanIR_Chr04g0153301 [Helianthus annuus]